MPAYISLVNWTDQGIRNVKDTVKRLDRGAEVAEKYGVRLKQTYWTAGPYDMVSISGATDDEAATTSSRSALQGTFGPLPFARMTAKRCRGYSLGLADSKESSHG